MLTATTVSSDLRDRFLGGMSQMASTVNIVTTDGPSGRYGLTVSAMASVSADLPNPVLLACVNRSSNSAQAILDNGVFCVNILRDDQATIADCFAGRWQPVDGSKFSCAEWVTGTTGAPRLADPLAAFDCRLMSTVEIGTHRVLYGAVEHVFVAAEGSPLLYSSRSYGSVARLANLDR